MRTLKSKRVSSGKYIAACCPFCENVGKTADAKYHLYILPGKWYFCFRCNKKGSYENLIKNFGFSIGIVAVEEHEKKIPQPDDFDRFMKENTKPFDHSFCARGAIGYLRMRNITDDLIGDMDIRLGTELLFGRVVFVDAVNKYSVARTFLPNMEPKTLNRSVAARPLMYSRPGRFETLYIVEGTFDMVPFLKTERDVVALLGKDISPHQLLQLHNLRVGNIVIALDVDALDGSVKLSNAIVNANPLCNIGIMVYNNRSKKDPSEWDIELFNNISVAWQRVLNHEILNEV